MKPLLVMLLVASSLHAQTLAEVARKERERQAKARASIVITSVETAKTEEAKPAAGAPQPASTDGKSADAKTSDGKTAEPAKEPVKPASPAAADPVQVWNNQLNQLRNTVRSLQDQEMTLVLQLNQANNQVYAPNTDPATQQRALAQVGQIQQQLDTVRKDLLQARTSLDALQLQGPPKAPAPPATGVPR
jgi:hypothetical protein